MKRTPSDNMQAMYAAKRNETINKISSAIQEIEDDNRIVTKKELISLTGLSSGTFSKPYVLELLKIKRYPDSLSANHLSTYLSNQVQEARAYPFVSC